MRHKRIRNLLYEFVRGELEADEHNNIEDHLKVCEPCANRADEFREMVALIDDQVKEVSEEKPPEFWNEFARNVEDRIRIEDIRRAPTPFSLQHVVEAIVLFHRRQVVAVGAGLVILLLGFLVSKWSAPVQPVEMDRQISAVIPPADSLGERIEKYLRKSKSLLVGITHLKTDNDQALDLTVERKVSRELVREARDLRKQPLDPRSSRLFDDMEKIMIGLANLEKTDAPFRVDIIRDGIREENLLYKVRMAEARNTAARFMNVTNRF